MLKNFTFSEALWKIPLRILLDWLFAFKSLFQKDGATFFAVFKAHGSVIKWIFLHKKQQKLPAIKISGINGVYKGMLIWQYFIKKKKLFSEIILRQR